MLKRIFVIIYPPYNITTEGRKHEMASQLPCSFNLFAHQQTLRFYWNCTVVLSQSLGFLWVNSLGGFDKGISYIISSLSCSLAMLAGPCAAHMVCIVTPSIWAYPPMFLWFAIQPGCTYSTDDVLVTVLEFSFEGLPLLWCCRLDIIYKNNWRKREIYTSCATNLSKSQHLDRHQIAQNIWITA